MPIFDVGVVGHFSIDSILLPNRPSPFVVLGGSAAYVSLAARRLDARVLAISKVGDDFPNAYLWWLEQEGINLSNVKKVEKVSSTRFELRYDEGLTSRILQSKSRAPPLTVEDLPDSMKIKAIHLAPIADEITYEVAKKLRGCAEILSLDPQGLIRSFDENGDVSLKPLVDKRILELVDIFKCSLEEIEAVTGLSELDSAMKALHSQGIKIAIITMGKDGATISVENTLHKVLAYESEKIIDPTGAGDAFIGGFLAEYVRGEDCSWCSHVGSAAASLVVEGIGPTFFGDKEEIYRRANALHEKEIKD